MDIADFGVTNILAKDPMFQRNWKNFCNAVKLDKDIFYDLEQLEKNNAGISHIASLMMEMWKSSAGSDVACMESLCSHLNEIGCTDCAKKIKEKIPGKPEGIKRLNKIKIHLSERKFNCKSLELHDCQFFKDKKEIFDISDSIGKEIKSLRITCNNAPQVNIKLNYLKAVECVNFTKVRLLLENVIDKMSEIREIEFYLVEFFKNQEEVSPMSINEIANFEKLQKLTLKGENDNMSVDLSDAQIAHVDVSEIILYN